jgi:hypothetical protein
MSGRVHDVAQHILEVMAMESKSCTIVSTYTPDFDSIAKCDVHDFDSIASSPPFPTHPRRGPPAASLCVVSSFSSDKTTMFV